MAEILGFFMLSVVRLSCSCTVRLIVLLLHRHNSKHVLSQVLHGWHNRLSAANVLAGVQITRVPVWLLKTTRNILKSFQWARDAADRLVMIFHVNLY